MLLNSISESLLDVPYSGRNSQTAALREHLGTDPMLLVFLRHLGCMFAQEMVVAVRAEVERNPSFPSCLIVHQESAAEAAPFFAQHWPAARTLADPQRRLYQEFRIPMGGLLQVLGPGAIACGIRAVRKGHRITGVTANPWVMPGMVLVQGRTIRWEHRFAHVGDLPDLRRISRHP